MEILSRKIKIPNKRIKLDEVKHAFNIWEEPTDKILSIFYKEDDKQLLDEKWDIITLFLEEKLAGTGFLPLINELVLFTKGKKELKSVHFFFVDKKIPKSEYFKHSLSDFKKNYYRANEESELIQNTFRIDFEQQLFGNSSFWLVKEYEGVIDRSKINWNFRCETTILPVKFSNENSNGIIDLGDILYKMFPSNANAYEFATKSISILVRYVFFNFATREYYSLKEKENMSKEEKHFFDNINIKEILLKNNNKIILMEDGSNYLMSLEQ